MNKFSFLDTTVFNIVDLNNIRNALTTETNNTTFENEVDQTLTDELKLERNPIYKLTSLSNEQFDEKLSKNICSILLNPEGIEKIQEFNSLLEVVREIKEKNFKNFNDHYNQNIQEVLDSFLNTNNQNIMSYMKVNYLMKLTIVW